MPQCSTAISTSSAPSGPGFWFPPTVLTPARTDRTVTEEIFGPVATILTYDSLEDGIELANSTEYGLSAAITGDPAKAAAAPAQQPSSRPTSRVRA